LINPVVHEPFADGDCESCHAAPADGVAMAAVDAVVCLDCHDDKAEGAGHQHTGDVACASCHTPHASRFESLTYNPTVLCTNCHDDVLHVRTEGDQTVTLHKPIQDGSCLDCHKLHEPEADSFLADNQRVLCGGCHESIQQRAEHSTKHDPFAKGKCESCHATHASTDRHMLKKDEEKLCKTCHRLGTVEMSSKHKNIPLSGEGCSTCHDPHSTAQARSGLMLPVLHSPFEDGDCSSCHTAGGSTTQSMGMCIDCHEGDHDYSQAHAGGRMGGDAGGVGVCLDCHSPHAGHGQMLRRSSEAETCYQCHDRNDFLRKTVHGALEDGCTTCHNLHESNFGELQSTSLNEMCAECHESAEMHAHPLGADFKDPRSNGPLICSSCHEPHSSDHDYMLTFDYRRDLCVQCHQSGTMKVH
jgi:predicted CXXCH cytochrome family protein